MRIAVWLTHNDVDCWNFSEKEQEHLQRNLNYANVIRCTSKKEFLKALPEAEVALIWRFEQEWFEAAPMLRYIITPAAGKDYFNVTPPDKVKLIYSSYHGEIMAETALAWMLAHSRGLYAAIPPQKSKKWDRKTVSANIRTFRGSNVTIVGFGSIGTWIGRLSKSLGANIVGIKRELQKRPDFFKSTDRLLSPKELNDILPWTDHLVLTLPRDASTDHFLNEERLNLLPSHCGVYNLGRGNAIDEAALAEALEKGRIGGAYLDVTSREPLPSKSPLWTAKNCRIMPHLSAVSPSYMNLFIQELVDLFNRIDA